MEEILRGEKLTGSGKIKIAGKFVNYYRFSGTATEKQPFLYPNREVFCLIRKTESNNVLMVGDYFVSEKETQMKNLEKILRNITID